MSLEITLGTAEEAWALTFGLGEVRGEVDSLVVGEESRGTGAGTRPAVAAPVS